MAIISAVGALIQNGSGGSGKTLSVNPTAVGNAILLVTDASNTSTSGTINVSAVTGGNCTGWTELVGPFKETTDSFDEIGIWMGVATATGSATITVTTSGTLSASDVYIMAQQFTAGGGAATVWAQDGTGVTQNNSGSSATVTYPTMTPAGADRLYIGFGFVANTGLTTGQTSGYTAQLDSVSNIVLYDPNVSTAQSPTAQQNSTGKSSAIAALVYATIPTSAQSLYITNTAMKRASYY